MSVSLPTSTIEPFFFAPRNRVDNQQLYGVYHEPPTWPAREVGVVLCYPHGQEMLRSHRAFHFLAAQTAFAGFPTLRFDPAGSGDSAGDGAQMTLAGWIEDIRLAVEELRTRSGVGPVVLAGLRMGASAALLAANSLSDICGMVLWEPVINGANYLEELRTLHEATINRFFVLPRDHIPTAHPAELLGFAMPNPLRAAIEQVNLLEVAAPRSRALLLDEHQGAPEMAALAAHFAQTTRVAHEIIPSFTVWVEDVDKGLVPQPLIEAIIHWLEATFP